ncbi:MAG: 4'-phosphopantetheinyl transferase superfamily protein [Candidatus Omnitrophota bacterium]|jgi:phosphopantetheinyl transferase (holo-ACP synthase)
MTAWPKTPKFDRILKPGLEAGRCTGVGIDILARKRASVFLRRHGRRISGRLLSKRERAAFPGAKLTPLVFSRLFAAKEAYFKACGGTWMGLEGFSSIDVEFLSGRRFCAFSSSIRPRRGRTAEGVFFGTRDFIGAEILIWDAPGRA